MRRFNCNWVNTGWQRYSTHLHKNSTQKNTIYWLSAIVLTPRGSSTVHIYTKTVHKAKNIYLLTAIGVTHGGSSTGYIYTYTVQRAKKYIC
jgi:hypothetical protein